MSNLGKLNTATAVYTDEDLERLKASDVDEVYEYEDKHLEPWQKMDAADAGVMGADIRRRYLEERGRSPDKSDDDIRGGLEGASRAWGSFARDSHRTVFLSLTNRDTGEREIGIMHNMMDVRARVDRGELDEADAEQHIQEYLLEQCKGST
jgi:hypothetical protein